MCGLLQSLHVIAPSHFKNQTAEDNLDVLRLIPLFFKLCSSKQLFAANKPYELSHAAPPVRPFPFLLHSLFPLSLRLSSPAPSAPRAAQLFLASHTHAPVATALAYQCGIALVAAAAVVYCVGCCANLNHIG